MFNRAQFFDQSEFNGFKSSKNHKSPGSLWPDYFFGRRWKCIGARIVGRRSEPTFSFFQRNLRLTLIDRPPPPFHVSEKKCHETLPTMFRTGFRTPGREPVTLRKFQNLGLTATPKPRISMPFRGTITLFCLLLSSFGCIEKC